MSQASPVTSASQPLVSIVVPTYNRAHLLPLALASCLGQTYRNLEVIVVNDGSRDHTAEILEQAVAADSRVRAFNKSNEGIADTLNYGHDRARGVYVTWTSDDNLYYPEAIEVMAGYLQAHPDVGMVYGDARFIDADDRLLRIVHAPEPDVMTRQGFLQAASLYRREIYSDVGGFRREWVRCQDWDFYIRAHRRHKVAHVPRVLYDYRWHEASMSGDHAAHVVECCQLLCSFTDDRNRRRDIWRDGWRDIAHGHRRDGHYWRAGYFEWRALRFAPSALPKAWNDWWRAFYLVCVPESVKRLWRRVKQGASRP